MNRWLLRGVEVVATEFLSKDLPFCGDIAITRALKFSETLGQFNLWADSARVLGRLERFSLQGLPGRTYSSGMAEPLFEISSGSSLPPLPAGRPTGAEKADGLSCADALKYDDIWKGNATLQRKNGVRLQNFGGGKLEIQLAASKPLVTAQVLVQPRIKEAFHTGKGEKYHEAIRKRVVEALHRSLGTLKTHLVTV